MDDVHLGQLLRAARIRRGWRQVDLAQRAEVSQVTVSRAERGLVDRCRLGDLRRLATALEIQLDMHARWRGGEGERLVSARHSAMAEELSRTLVLLGWTVRPEVSFSVWGERGVIDVLAWHPLHRALLVVELKTELVDIGELLGTLDRKRRLAPGVARDLGWSPASVSAVVFLLDGRTNRRQLARHAAVLRAALPYDGRALRAWLPNPARPIDALAFLPESRAVTTRPPTRGVHRVRDHVTAASTLRVDQRRAPSGTGDRAGTGVTRPGARGNAPSSHR